MALYQTFMVAISFLYLFIIPVHLCFATSGLKKASGFSLKVIHRDSPESPLYPGDDLTFHERMSRYVRWTHARASYVASIATQNGTTVDSFLRPPVFADGYYYYMVGLGVGTPEQAVMLLLDTGTGLSWTQCLPCESCYEQSYPIYNSTASQTFQPLHCDHPLCSDMIRCVANTCRYEQRYGTGEARTTGVAMTETLTFETDIEGEDIRYSDIIMGCSTNNQNFNFETNGNIAGILGLSPSPHSIISQLDGIVERKFSYCLPNDPRLTSYLRFGSDIVVRGTGQVQSTPFVHVGNYYFALNLSDISIAGNPINYPPGTFAPRPNGGGGCFIDSGAPYSVIDRPAFNTFIAAFENFFAPNVIKRNTKDCTSPDSYCYYVEGVDRFPYITLHFAGGANYMLQPENYMVKFDQSWFQLAFVPGDLTILGAWQQHDMRLIYDLHEGSLSFVYEDCTHDND